jgi:hypothetical protein
MAARETDLLTQADYARHRESLGLPGGTREAVRLAVKEGRISTIDGRIHPVIADAEWVKNTRARVSPQAAAKSPGPNDLVGQAGTPAADPPPVGAAAAPADTSYTAARARREQAEADLAEMNAKKARGELVAWEDVVRGGFEVGRDLRDTMDSAVNSLSAELAVVATADQCADILRRHHRAIADVLIRSWREKIGPVPGGLQA